MIVDEGSRCTWWLGEHAVRVVYECGASNLAVVPARRSKRERCSRWRRRVSCNSIMFPLVILGTLWALLVLYEHRVFNLLSSDFSTIFDRSTVSHSLNVVVNQLGVWFGKVIWPNILSQMNRSSDFTVLLWIFAKTNVKRAGCFTLTGVTGLWSEQFCGLTEGRSASCKYEREVLGASA
jgi:hypothetical protein